MTASRRLAVWGVVSLLLAVLVIQYSLRDGRLSATPGWDDVMYMRYGAARVNDLYSQGVLACLKAYAAETPHSPYSCLLAFVSYVIFGLHDWAPYLGSFVAVALFLWLVDWLLGGVRLHIKVLAALYVCTVPTVVMTLSDFMPHIPWGMAIAGGALMAVLRPFLSASKWHWAKIGALWGAAMLIKTSTVPATLALLGLCLFLATVRDWAETRTMPRVGQLVRSWGTVLLVTVLIAAPHYYLHGRYVFFYIWHTMFGENHDAWALKGDWLTQVRYYLDGEGGWVNLAGHLYVLPVFWLVGGAVAAWRRDTSVLLGGAAALIFVVACYTIGAVNPAKNTLLAAEFYTTLIAASVYWIGYLMRVERTRFGTNRLGTVLLVGLVVSGACLFRWPGRYFPPGSAERAQDLRLHAEVYDTIRAQAKPYEQTVTIMALGPVRQITLDYMATLDRLPFAFERPFSARLSDYEPYCDRSDMVLAQEAHVLGCGGETMPSEQVQDKVLEMIRRRDDFAPVREFTAADGKKLVLFKRTRWSRGVMRQVRPAAGFGPIQGPYPESNLPLCCWGQGRGGQLIMGPEHEGKAVLRLQFRPSEGVKGIRVTPEGGQAVTQQFAAPWVPQEIEVPVVARVGQRVTIEYDFGKGSGPKNGNSALFTLIELAEEPTRAPR